MRFNEVASMTGGRVKLAVNVVGVCDRNPDCLHFCDINHNPRFLVILMFLICVTCASMKCMSVSVRMFHVEAMIV